MKDVVIELFTNYLPLFQMYDILFCGMNLLSNAEAAEDGNNHSEDRREIEENTQQSSAWVGTSNKPGSTSCRQRKKSGLV